MISSDESLDETTPLSSLSRPSASFETWTRILDVFLPLLTAATLVVSCILASPKKELWVDEGYTLQVITDKSVAHMMRALMGGVDGGMPLYYVLAHDWAMVVGTALLSLRLLSSLLLCAGILVLWREMRRIYSAPAVSLGILAAIVTSGLVLGQNVELRFYGLYFACAVLVVVLHVRLASERAGPGLVLAAVAAHCALLLAHLFGVLYSAAAIMALLFTDYRSRRFRWGLYAKLMSSWLLLLVWLGPILKIRDLGQPHNWVSPPTFLSVATLFLFASPCVLLGLLLATGIASLAPETGQRPPHLLSNALAYHAFAYVLVPIPIAIVSFYGPSLFLDRYFLPSVIGVAILLTHLLDAVLAGKRMTIPSQAAWSLVLLVLLTWPVVNVVSAPATNTFRLLDQYLPSGLPVLVEDANAFIPLTYYASRPGRPYYYVLDWESALHSPSPHTTLQTKVMRNARAAGYNSDRIIDAKDVPCSFEKFLVLDSPDMLWFEERVLRNPQFAVEPYTGVAISSGGPRVWVVTRLYRDPACVSQ